MNLITPWIIQTIGIDTTAKKSNYFIVREVKLKKKNYEWNTERSQHTVHNPNHDSRQGPHDPFVGEIFPCPDVVEDQSPQQGGSDAHVKKRFVHFCVEKVFLLQEKMSFL